MRPEGNERVSLDHGADLGASGAAVRVNNPAVLHRWRQQAHWQRRCLRPADGRQTPKAAFVLSDDHVVFAVEWLRANLGQRFVIKIGNPRIDGEVIERTLNLNGSLRNDFKARTRMPRGEWRRQQREGRQAHGYRADPDPPFKPL